MISASKKCSRPCGNQCDLIRNSLPELTVYVDGSVHTVNEKFESGREVSVGLSLARFLNALFELFN